MLYAAAPGGMPDEPAPGDRSEKKMKVRGSHRRTPPTVSLVGASIGAVETTHESMRWHTPAYRRSLHGIGHASADTSRRPPATPRSVHPPTHLETERGDETNEGRPWTRSHPLSATSWSTRHHHARCKKETHRLDNYLTVGVDDRHDLRGKLANL
jgi:hypothetical protein